jgi:hypothetical protein
VAWRRGRRGRPRKLDAKRRATTTAGRRPEIDPGTPQLVARKAHVANGWASAVELTDVPQILRANELIVDEELVQLRILGGWLKQAAVAFKLRQASPSGLWSAILSGQAGGSCGWLTPLSASDRREGGDRAMFRLGELYTHFTELDRLDLLSLVMRIAAAEAYPENAFELAELRRGLQIIMHLQRRGRSQLQPSA